MRDDIRGLLGVTEDTMSRLDRPAKAARQLTYMATGGGVGEASIADMSIAIFQFGMLRTFRQPFATLVRNLNEFRMSARETALVREPIELVADSQQVRFFDMEDELIPRTRLERGLQKATHAFSIINFITPWNRTVRNIAGYYTQGFIIESGEILARGGKLSKADAKRLIDLGLSDKKLVRIYEEWLAFGVNVQRRSKHAVNSTAWQDRVAVNDMRAAIAGGSQEVPRMLRMHRSFGLASGSRVLLRALQYADMRSLSGLMSSVGLAMLTIKMRDLRLGRDRERSAREWAGLAWERSSFAGILFDGDRLFEAAAQGEGSLSTLLGTRGELRYFSPRDVLSAALGPVAGQGSDLLAASLGFADLDPDPQDISRLRRLMVLQNAYGFRRLFDEIETGARQAVED